MNRHKLFKISLKVLVVSISAAFFLTAIIILGTFDSRTLSFSAEHKIEFVINNVFGPIIWICILALVISGALKLTEKFIKKDK